MKILYILLIFLGLLFNSLSIMLVNESLDNMEIITKTNTFIMISNTKRINLILKSIARKEQIKKGLHERNI